MSTEKPIIKSATVTLTLASGETLRLYLDDIDQTIEYALEVERDVWEAKGAAVLVSTDIPGDRQRVDVRLVGRGSVAAPPVCRSRSAAEPVAVPAVTADGSDQEAEKEN